jgi:hypothetical protein
MPPVFDIQYLIGGVVVALLSDGGGGRVVFSHGRVKQVIKSNLAH